MGECMKLEDLGKRIWEASYIVFLAIILANYWIGYNMRDISPLPAKFPIAFIVAPLCGALVYLFSREVKRALYGTLALCTLACIFTALFIALPSFHGLMGVDIGTALALRFTVVMAIFVYPLAIGGAFATGYLYPE